MIKHTLFVKGERIHALLSSFSNPNILIPVKALVKDVKYDEYNPQYIIKVIQFYDTPDFLKKFLLGMAFTNKFNKRARKFNIKKNQFKNRKELLELMNGENESKYYFMVDSIMTSKYEGELKILFNKVQDFLIERKLGELKRFTTRLFYRGKYDIKTKAEFQKRLKNFIGDKIEDLDIDLEDFNRLL